MEIPKEIYEIDLKEIQLGESNVRATDREAGLDELKESIKKYGLLQPIILRGSYHNPPYELIVGQRRFLAHKKLGRDTIRAVFSGEVNDIQAKILSLTENMHRVELNHADKAEAITALYRQYGKDDRRVAQELGLPLRTVRDYIKIEEEATPKAKARLKRGNISRTDLKRVIDASQGDPEKADRFLDEIPKLSKYEKSRAVEYARSHPEAPVSKIIEEGMKPRLERTIMLNVPREINVALSKAEQDLSMEAEVIAARALSEWLKNNGFLR